MWRLQVYNKSNFEYPLPRVEELLNNLQRGQFVSKLDLSSAYQQLILNEEPHNLTTIVTHKGLFRY